MAQVSLVKYYLPKNEADEVVGAYVKTMGEVWVQLDKRFGDPVIIADDTCQSIKQLLGRTLGKEFIPRFHSLVRNAAATLEACSQAEQV